MKSYKYLSLYTDYVVIESTDPEVLDWIFTEVKRLIPTCQTRGEMVLPSGKKCAYTLHKLQGRDRQMALWILQQLCQRGWEPFAVNPEMYQGSNRDGFIIHLRQEVISD